MTLKKKDTCGIYEKTVKWFSYAGPQVHKIQSATFVECMLDLVCPPSRRKVWEDGRPQHSDPNFDQACFELYNRSMEAWVAHNECWYLMNNDDYSPVHAFPRNIVAFRTEHSQLPPYFGRSCVWSTQEIQEVLLLFFIELNFVLTSFGLLGTCRFIRISSTRWCTNISRMQVSG